LICETALSNPKGKKMKKIISLSGAVLVLVSTIHAQTTVADASHDMAMLNKDEKVTKHEMKKEKRELRKLDGSDVSYQSKEAFKSDFSDVHDVTWVRGAYNDQATFINKKGEEETAYYDFYSQLIGTTEPKAFTDLPARAQKFINEKYSDFSKEAVIFFEDNEMNDMDMVLYGDAFEDADNYFIELKKDKEKLVLRVDENGYVYFFKRI
jgi:hypothetical protein